MPVEDHPTHEKVIQKEGFRYEACQGKTLMKSYFVLTRKYGGYGYAMQLECVEDTSSKACRYMDYEHDSGCTGCLQPRDMQYIEKMRGLK